MPHCFVRKFGRFALVLIALALLPQAVLADTEYLPPGARGGGLGHPDIPLSGGPRRNPPGQMFRDDGQSDVVRVVSARSGADQILWFHGPVDVNCTPAISTVTFRPTAPAQHGVLRMVSASGPVHFSPPNPRSACDGRIVPGQRAIYRSAPGFKGVDFVEYAMFWPGVRVYHFRFKMMVQ